MKVGPSILVFFHAPLSSFRNTVAWSVDSRISTIAGSVRLMDRMFAVRRICSTCSSCTDDDGGCCDMAQDQVDVSR